MLLGEPGRTQGDLNFVLFGIPVRVHPMFWLIGVLLGPFRSGLPEVLIWMVAFFVGILLHELGHAVVIRAFGFRPSIVLYGLGGLAMYYPGQIGRVRVSSALRQILISAAGPAAGFLLAAAVVAGLIGSGHPVEYALGGPSLVQIDIVDIVVNRNWTWFLQSLLFVTVVYGALNLLPIQPLDGGRIAREILMAVHPAGGYRLSLVLSVLVAGGLAVIGAVQWHDWFVALFFGLLAYESLLTLQAGMGRGLW